MPFTCPECEKKHSLQIIRSIELPADSRSDEITLQVVECRTCGFSAIAVYEESRRGALGSEVFNHTGYRIGRKDGNRLKAAMKSCPHPKNADCNCDVHQRLGSLDKNGRWNGLTGISQQGIFEMVLSRDEPAQ